MVRPAPIKSICFFSSYYITPTLPEYIKFYLAELARHFSEVVFLTNEKNIAIADLEFLHNLHIPFRLYKNEGFDFGMWHKAFQEFNISGYDKIGLVNDSCLLFKSLDFFFEWLEEQEVDYAGITDCNSIHFHVQSYFLIINKKAIAPVAEYFQQHGVIAGMKETIKIYEVGLSEHLAKLGLKLKAYYSVNSIPFPFLHRLDSNGKLKGNFLRHPDWQLFRCYKGQQYMLDPTWFKAKELIRKGIPLIKKKILIRQYGDADWIEMTRLGFDPDPRHYIKLIKNIYPDQDIDALLKGINYKKALGKELRFYYALYLQNIRFFISHKIYVVKRAIVLMLGRY